MRRDQTILFQIRSCYAQLRPSEQRATDYIQSNIQQLADLSLANVAEQAGVSQPTVLRLLRALGYDGYRDFQRALLREQALNQPEPPSLMYGYQLSRNDPVASVPARIVATTIQSLETMLQNISGQDIERIVDTIRRAHRIAIFGVENSLVTARDLSTKLLYLGLPCVCYDDYYLQKILAGSLGEQDIAIGISYSGRSRDTVEIMQAAKQVGAQTVVITNFQQSPIAQYGNIVLCGSNEQLLYGDAIFSRTTQLAIVDMIYWGVILSDYEYYANILDQNSRLMRDKAYPE